MQYLNKPTSKSIKMPGVCRICLDPIQQSTPVILLNAVILNNSYISYRDKLTACVPEIALDAVNEPIMCQECTINLQTAYEFRNRCVETEVIIQTYIQERASPAIINLNNDFVQYVRAYESGKKSEENAVSGDAENILLVSNKSPINDFEVTSYGADSDVVILGAQSIEEEESLFVDGEVNLADMVEVVDEVRFDCLYCSASFITKKELNKHGKMHKKRVMSKCSFCERSFKSLRYLHRHLQSHREYTCSVCGEEFDDKIKFDKHLKRHNKTDRLPSARRGKTKMPIIRKRGNLPKHATKYMRKWLLEHYEHPYPNDGEKQQIAETTQLTVLQVENWFINARRRVLQPLLSRAQHTMSNNGIEELIDNSESSEND